MFTGTNYDPVDTETFNFFGNPEVVPRLSPLNCFIRDVKNLFLEFGLVRVVLAVLYTDRPIDELYTRAPTFYSLVWFGACSAVQFILGLPLVFLFWIAVIVVGLLTKIHSYIIWHIIQGPQIQVYPPNLPPKYNPAQRWIYINGIATGKTITRQNLQNLSELFHNPVLAVNNRTYGFLGDLLECIVQRAFNYRTKETGIALHIMRTWLSDPSVDKVILIAHSQGGIIASHLVDDLLCEAASDELAKLEVYTFGSAALTFNNPYKDKLHFDRVIPVIEHYCNERDMVTSWGALASVNRQELPFAGKVFVNHGQTGHMLNQHYLGQMFTGPSSKWTDDCYLFRRVRQDSNDKYHVLLERANISKGERSVQTESKLWNYLK